MLSDQYRREIAQLSKDLGKLRTEIGKEEENAHRARAAAAQKRSAAQRTSSLSTRQSYERQAETEDKKVSTAEKKIGGLHDKVGTLVGRISTKEQSFRSAERSEQDAQRRKDKSAQDAKDRASKRQRQIEIGHAREISRLSRPTVHHVYIRPPEPAKLRVLYLTASPVTANLEGLRVDAEVNNVLKALRGATHRDLIEFHYRPAATIDDLVNGLNDFRPHVVHFSGHAGGGLLLDTADLLEPGDKLVDYASVARILHATDQRPTLVVLNACQTIEGATSILEAAPVVIATTEPVGDASSGIFATQFYAAIAAAQTIGHAVDQARAMISVALPDTPDALTVLTADGLDPYEITLVKPASDANANPM